MARFTLDDFARMIDHTYLKQNATEADMADTGFG